MMCPLCGVDVLPGKVCLNCGYDPSRPDVRPPAKPSIPDPPSQDDAYNTRNWGQAVTEKKAAKSKAKEKAAAATPPRAPFPEANDILEQIDRLGSPPTAAMPPPRAKPAAPASTPPASQRPVAQPPPPTAQAMPPRSKLQQASVPVTTQFAFESQHIVGYAGLVVATVVVRLGEPDDLLPEGQDVQRLSGGPIGMRLRKAIDVALADLKTEAIERGGNGVVGARLEVLPAQGPLAIVTLIGTAVVLE